MADRCKYEKYQYQVSYNSGATWENVTPIQVRKGDITEYMSLDCSEIETLYRWVDLQGTYICDGNNKYTKEIQEESYDDGVTWYASYPTVYRQGTFVGIDEDYCADKFEGHYEITDGSSKCGNGYRWNGYKCVRVDPLKVVKCNDSTTLKLADVTYYESNYTLVSCKIGNCVSSINVAVFANNPYLTSVTISDSVASIGGGAFSACTNLPTINITNGSIGTGAFFRCSGLTSVDIGSGVTSIGSNAFAWCTSLTSLTIPSSVTSIGGSALGSNTKKIVFNGSMQYKAGMLDNGYLETALLGDSVTSIGGVAFSNSINLTSCTIGNGVTSIGNSAFNGCSGLTSCTIGSGVTEIGLAAFEGCRSLVSMHIPSACTKFHGYCFSGCTSLSSLTIDSYVIDSNTGDGNWYYGQFSWCTSLQEVSFPNLSGGSIPPDCFSNCSSLSSVTLGNPTEISNGAFYNCISLTSIDLGNNVTVIGSHALEGCSALTDVYIRTKTNPTSVNSTSFPLGVRIHVSCETFDWWYYNTQIYRPIDWIILPIEDDCLIEEWRAEDISVEYDCVGVDKHYKEYKYISADSGTTWYKTKETRAGSLYEANSVDCGYVPTNYTVKYTFSNGNTSAVTNTTTIGQYSYGYDVVSVEIGNLATNIYGSAFKDFNKCTNFVVPSNNIISGVTSSVGLFFNFGTTTNIITLDLRNLTGLTNVGAADFYQCHASVIFPNTLTTMNGNSDYPCFKSNTPNIQYTITFTSSTPPTVYNSQYIFTFTSSSDTYQKFLVRVPSGSASAYETAFSGSLSRIIIEEY
jgi:hypothetical protein